MGFKASVKNECDATRRVHLPSQRDRASGGYDLWSSTAGTGQINIVEVKCDENPPEFGAKNFGKAVLEKCRASFGIARVEKLGHGWGADVVTLAHASLCKCDSD